MSLLPFIALILASAQQPTTIRVPVRLVIAPALVFSKQGKLIFGLQKSDFRLYDNGRLQNLNLDTDSRSVSAVVLVQTNREVREYLPFIAKVGSVIDNLFLGETGEAAVLTYNDDVTLKKDFDRGDVHSALKDISAGGQKARAIDAAFRAVAMLKGRSSSRLRVLLFIGQPMDSGSDFTLAALQAEIEKENISIYAMALPEFGKKFVSDTFSLSGLGSQGTKGGYVAGVELTKLIPALRRSSKALGGKDPFSVLTAATGGTELHFREQDQLEDGIIAFGAELRSAYLLSYSPDSTDTGYHKISIDVDVPGAKSYSRPGYTLTDK